METVSEPRATLGRGHARDASTRPTLDGDGEARFVRSTLKGGSELQRGRLSMETVRRPSAIPICWPRASGFNEADSRWRR